MILGLLIIIGIIFVGGTVFGITNIVSGGKLLGGNEYSDQLMKMATSNLQEILVCSIVRVKLSSNVAIYNCCRGFCYAKLFVFVYSLL